MSAREWSPYQTGCFDFVEHGTGNAIVVAVAGSGKTTTGEEMVKRIPRYLSHVYLAFNKPIADTLKARGINGRTFHSLCFGPVLRHKGVNDVTKDKLRKLVNEMLGEREVELYGQFIIRLVSLARNAGIGTNLCQDITEVWQGLVEYHDLELESEHANMDTAVEYARKLLDWSNKSDLVDFDDMLYIAVRDGVSLPKFDFVFVDEAQDTNAIQRAVLRKIMKATTRLICVGDPSQAIYGFRGADSNSMQLIADEFNCKSLPLTVSYRCATSIVAFSQKWCKHIEAAPNAPEGKVRRLGTTWKNSEFTPFDLIVCRTTKPLVQLCYSLLKSHTPARMMGKDVGEGLKNLIKKMRSKGIDRLIDDLGVYTTREAEKAIAAGQDAKTEAIQDKTDAVLCLIEGIDENSRTIPELLRVIDSMFDERVQGVTLATIHKAKGLEADRVFWLNSSKCPAQWARKEWQMQQERNLCYVAATRAKSELVLIEERDQRREVKVESEDEAA